MMESATDESLLPHVQKTDIEAMVATRDRMVTSNILDCKHNLIKYCILIFYNFRFAISLLNLQRNRRTTVPKGKPRGSNPSSSPGVCILRRVMKDVSRKEGASVDWSCR